MSIDSISVHGFANISGVSLSLQEITALIAPNGYGKSNLLRAIDFGCRFITVSDSERLRMMSDRNAMPINKTMLRQDFRMEICGSVGTMRFEYGYSFQWIDPDVSSDNSISTGGIRLEWLRMRQDEQKFRQALLRESASEYRYLSTASGRCTNSEVVNMNQLAIGKMADNSGLFYAPLVTAISHLIIPQLDTLDNPDSYFSADNSHGIAMLDGQTLSAYIYHLRERQPMVYQVLADGIQALVPHLTRFEPTMIVLGDGRSKLYDILIEERNSAYPTSVRQISSGSKRAVLLFTLCVAAQEKGIPLLMMEEPENSVHPRLLENMLLSIHDYAGETKVLLTSHSPYLMRYMRAGQMYFGLPNTDDLAKFAKLKDAKVKTIAKYASAMELTVGEYMFDFMLDLEDNHEKIAQFFEA